jgi:hypothetical protein
MLKASTVFLCVLTALLTVQLTNGQYQGILMNGLLGATQLYDPFNTPHASGNLKLRLQTGTGAQSSAAVIVGNRVYFDGGLGGDFSI